MIKTRIVDGSGRGTSAHVEDDALLVTQYACPPMIPQKNQIYSQYLTVDGLVSGSNDMGIDGSVTTVPFYLNASDEGDIYVTSLSFQVGYGSVGELFEFADDTDIARTGFRLYYERGDGTEIDIHDAIKTNSDLLRLCIEGNLGSNWEARHFAANNDYGYMCTMDLQKMMPPYGVKLDMGSKQRIVFEVRDDNTDADIMDARAYGFERFE